MPTPHGEDIEKFGIGFLLREADPAFDVTPGLDQCRGMRGPFQRLRKLISQK
jgi:hypothetical protein